MRDIVFRGKLIDGSDWVIGYLIIDKDGTNWIVNNHGASYTWDEVIPETVGQLMPIKDANGVSLFEGDIVSGNRTPDNFHPASIVQFPKRIDYKLVEYSNTETISTFNLPKDISYSERILENNIHWILAGNKFDNPELLQSL